MQQKRKQHYLNLFKAEYNILKVAKCSKGYRHIPESKAKYSSRIISEQTLKKLSERVKSELTKDKISLSLGIPEQVIDTLKEETMVFVYNILAASHLDTSDSTIGPYIKPQKLLFSRYLIS